MEKNEMLKLVNEGLSLKEMSDKTNKSIPSIRYWLRKYKLKTKRKQFNIKCSDEDKKYCPKCEIVKDKSEFFKRIRKGRENLSGYCKKCTSRLNHDKQKENKKRAVEYKGGKCIICSYNRCNRALEFHHLDPTEKDFGISKKRNNNWDKLKKELDKCVLLCNRCHSEVHDGIHNIEDYI